MLPPNEPVRSGGRRPSVLVWAAALALAGPVAAADMDLRLVPQVMVGTAGLEPGAALEWRGWHPRPILRPEAFINEDGRVGGGGAILHDLSTALGLPMRHALAAGPRVVHHNSDDYDWEADALVIWSYDLVGGARSWRHSVELIGAAGVVRDKDDDDYGLGLSAGVGYAFGF
jgi:hypothetical protein